VSIKRFGSSVANEFVYEVEVRVVTAGIAQGVEGGASVPTWSSVRDLAALRDIAGAWLETAVAVATTDPSQLVEEGVVDRLAADPQPPRGRDQRDRPRVRVEVD
jgi:hypothetical protein